MRFAGSIAAVALLTTAGSAVAQDAPAKPAAQVRCDDWKKVGDHTWMVVKEVMLGAAPRQGEVLHDTPETRALDAKCRK